jgi:hypothetical protein
MNPEQAVQPKSPAANTPAPAAPAAPSSPPAAVNYKAFSRERHTPWLFLMPGIIGAVAFFALLIMAMTQTARAHQPLNSDTELPHGGLIVLALTVVFISIGLSAWRRSKYLDTAYRQFLADNRWSGITEPSTDDVATSMMGIGHSQKISDSFSGTYHGMPFRAVIYKYTTGSGRSSTDHFFADLHFELKQTFPLIVLDNKASEHFKFVDDLPRISDTHELQLEGNFNSQYKVSVMPGTEQEVLQVLTPDFMAELMNGSLKVDAELEANKLYIVKHGPTHWQAADLQALFAMADVMTKNLGELAGTWQASSSTSTVAAMTDTALVARQKAILQPQHWVGIGTVIVIIVYLFSWLFGYVFHF